MHLDNFRWKVDWFEEVQTSQEVQISQIGKCVSRYHSERDRSAKKK